jgi:hypothetical protein
MRDVTRDINENIVKAEESSFMIMTETVPSHGPHFHTARTAQQFQ